jgi:hypothetical protein
MALFKILSKTAMYLDKAFWAAFGGLGKLSFNFDKTMGSI